MPLEVLQWVLASLCGEVDVLLEHTQGQVLFKLECKLTSNNAVRTYFCSVWESNLKKKAPFLKFWQFMTIFQLPHWSLHFYRSLTSSDMTAIQDVNLYSCTTDRIFTHKQNRQILAMLVFLVLLLTRRLSDKLQTKSEKNVTCWFLSHSNFDTIFKDLLNFAFKCASIVLANRSPFLVNPGGSVFFFLSFSYVKTLTKYAWSAC